MDPKRIFTPEQIQVPPALPGVLKEYAKAVLRSSPQTREEIVAFSVDYFREKAGIPG
ncbi:unnamed protein product, partial [Phaeothamnion confervicola]